MHTGINPRQHALQLLVDDAVPMLTNMRTGLKDASDSEVGLLAFQLGSIGALLEAELMSRGGDSFDTGGESQ